MVNLYAFWHPIEFPEWGVAWFIYFPGFLFSAMFAYGLYYFTDLFSDLLLERNQLGEIQTQLTEKNQKISSLETQITEQNQNLSQLQEEREELLAQIFETEENGEKVNELLEKAGQFDLLLQYILEKEGYLNKSPEALRKGVEYWTKKQKEGDSDLKSMIKLLSYKGASQFLTSKVLNVAE